MGRISKQAQVPYRQNRYIVNMFTVADEILVYSELGRGKYGRLLVEVVCDGVNAGDALIEVGLARPYDGGTKNTEPW